MAMPERMGAWSMWQKGAKQLKFMHAKARAKVHIGSFMHANALSVDKGKNAFITILSAAIKVSSSFKLSPCTVIYNLFHAAASPFVPRLNFTVKGHWQSSCILRAMACNLCLSFNSTRNPISSDRITYERGEGTQNV